jgi:curved DNA-binding protein CbpA
MPMPYAGDPAPDPYAVLGVEPSAAAEAVTSAFRARVRELRPDTNVDADTAARFGAVREAYDVLRDPVRRAAYDQRHERRHGRGHGRRSERAYGRADEPPPVRAPAYRPAAYRRHPAAFAAFVALGVPLGVPAREPPLRAGPVHWEPNR